MYIRPYRYYMYVCFFIFNDVFVIISVYFPYNINNLDVNARRDKFHIYDFCVMPLFVGIQVIIALRIISLYLMGVYA